MNRLNTCHKTKYLLLLYGEYSRKKEKEGIQMYLKSRVNQNVEMVKARVERVGYDLYSVEKAYAEAKKVLEENRI